MAREPRIDPVSIDVGGLVRRSVASLYSHLVTRPTGRAVRLAIETQVAEAGETCLSVVDLSEVAVLDFSCADEVVAKLLLRYLGEDRPREAFFVFHGVREPHRDPIEAVLERQALAAVIEEGDGRHRLLGSRSGMEGEVWARVEARGHLPTGEVEEVWPAREREALEGLVRRRLVFRAPAGGGFRALSTLVEDLPEHHEEDR